MTTKWKVAVVAAGLSLGAGDIQAEPVPAPRERPQPSADRIASLKSELDAQTQRLDAAAAAIAAERAQVERQKQELASFQTGDTASNDQLAKTEGKGIGGDENAAPAPLAANPPADVPASQPVRVAQATTSPVSAPSQGSGRFVGLGGSRALPKAFKGPRAAPRDKVTAMASMSAPAKARAGHFVALGGSRALPHGFGGPREAPRTMVAMASAQAPVATRQTIVQAQAAPAPASGQPAAKSDLPPTLSGRTEKNQFTVAADNPQPVQVAARKSVKEVVQAANAPGISAQASAQQEVGERPDKTKDVNIAVIADRGGVLTPRGTLVLDSEVDYSHTSVNRFFLDGIEIADAFTVGQIEAKDIDRNTSTVSVGARYGLTRSMEFDVHGSWLFGSDRETDTAVKIGSPKSVFDISGNGIGDIDFGFHWQMNHPTGNYPYFVANWRVKTPTGMGPYDVKRDLQTAQELELPTGSGFWTIEPSVTVIWPSDPAVLFANIGYQGNLKKDIDKRIQQKFETPNQTNNTTPVTAIDVGRVNPGDGISASFGMGFGLNDAVSLSFGYAHSWVFGTTTDQTISHYIVPGQINPTSGTVLPGVNATELDPLQPTQFARTKSNDAQVGSLLMGASVSLNQHVGFNVNVSAGLTADAPDVIVSFRMPLAYQLSK